MEALAISNPLRIDDDGVWRVGQTRVTLDTVVYAFLDGATPEAITQRYPSLSLTDVYAVISYYLQHRSEVEVYLQQRQQQDADVRKLIEAQPEMNLIRQRILARAARLREQS